MICLRPQSRVHGLLSVKPGLQTAPSDNGPGSVDGASLAFLQRKRRGWSASLSHTVDTGAALRLCSLKRGLGLLTTHT